MTHEPPPPGPVLEASRVRLEPIGAERAGALLSGRPEPGLPWEEGFPLPPLLAVLRRVLDEPRGSVMFGPFFAYVVIRRADGLAVGDAGFHGPPAADGEVELGYALVPRARGAGLATQSVALLADWALAQPGVRAVAARVEPGNVPSARLLERLGFAPRGPRGSHVRYVLTRTPRRR